ncbi:winged helix-turn-helix transcriptional regulator [Streptomyces sp. NPDC060194]|uniref:winged helix-turn-helix transcriptional regulator n=1 Tax=Streptomyces sp. NPDC060194 TaxID=3347069 RepID=UPI0036672F59
MATARRPGTYVCGIDAAMDVIGGKWKVLVLWALDDHPRRRFGELRRLIPGITEKVLASHLRELEAAGVVHREAYDEVPPRVEYSLTPLGVSLNAALEPLGAWGRAHVIEPAAGVAAPQGARPGEARGAAEAPGRDEVRPDASRPSRR